MTRDACEEIKRLTRERDEAQERWGEMQVLANEQELRAMRVERERDEARALLQEITTAYQVRCVLTPEQTARLAALLGEAKEGRDE